MTATWKHWNVCHQAMNFQLKVFLFFMSFHSNVGLQFGNSFSTVTYFKTSPCYQPLQFIPRKSVCLYLDINNNCRIPEEDNFNTSENPNNINDSSPSSKEIDSESKSNSFINARIDLEQTVALKEKEKLNLDEKDIPEEKSRNFIGILFFYWNAGLQKVKDKPFQTLSIPITAAFVGWFTNKLAVDMIFYPLEWRGIPLHVIEGYPFGWIGWQGIVPAKTSVMASRMTDMMTSELINIQEVFMQLNPNKIASLLAPEVNSMAQEIAGDFLPKSLEWLGPSVAAGLTGDQVDKIFQLRQKMLTRLVRDMQKNINSILDMKELVVSEMVADKKILVELFQKCGKEEFPFLVNSGLWLGFMLGIIQMFVWIFFDKLWTIPLGGLIVGIVTNALAIKLIFEPVDPIFMGPFKFQGLFLKRQQEVSSVFSKYLTLNVVHSSKIWKIILFGSRAPVFYKLVLKHLVPFIRQSSLVIGAGIDKSLASSLANKVCKKLPKHIHVLHDYTDRTLKLEETMNLKMSMMSSRTFEGVLHPVFQEDELTLIVAGGVLGLLAGLAQMYMSTDRIDSDQTQKFSVKSTKFVVEICRVFNMLTKPFVTTGRMLRKILLPKIQYMLRRIHHKE